MGQLWIHYTESNFRHETLLCRVLYSLRGRCYFASYILEILLSSFGARICCITSVCDGFLGNLWKSHSTCSNRCRGFRGVSAGGRSRKFTSLEYQRIVDSSSCQNEVQQTFKISHGLACRRSCTTVSFRIREYRVRCSSRCPVCKGEYRRSFLDDVNRYAAAVVSLWTYCRSRHSRPMFMCSTRPSFSSRF